MESATEALKHLDDYEAIRAQAIEEVETTIADLQQKLARLRGEQKAPGRGATGRKQEKCSVCGESGHTARKHKLQAQITK